MFIQTIKLYSIYRYIPYLFSLVSLFIIIIIFFFFACLFIRSIQVVVLLAHNQSKDCDKR